MRMTWKFLALLIVMATLALAGCDDDNGDSDESNGDADGENGDAWMDVIEVESDAGEDPPVITPDAEWSIYWEGTAPTEHRVRIYVSDSGEVDDDAVRVSSWTCDDTPRTQCEEKSGEFDCEFTNENEMWCGTKSSINTSGDLTDLLDQIPHDTYMVAQACERKQENCADENTEIRIE